ncbi:MAG: type II secretion system minor pseudopilin GspK [Arenicella sp.]|nr:type II secretion system minor pseudopilin GspK [Arenicella sp.]
MTLTSRHKPYQRQMPRHKRQGGVVLIVVVLAIVLMVTLLAIMIEDQHIFIRRLGNQKVAEQGYQYSQGLNSWAERVLHNDANRTIDHLGEKWAKFGRPEEENSGQDGESESFSFDRSTAASEQEDREEKEATIDFGIDGLEVSIDDLQGRYNLNNLAVKEPQAADGQKKIFLNLLELLEIGEFDERDRLYGALVDWIDENDLSGPNGFESGDYGSKRVPYFAADQKLTSIGELRFVEGFTEDVINKLRPFVTVLPVENAKININTTTAEVLASLNGATVTDISSVASFLAIRMDPGFQGFSRIQDAETAIIGASVVPSQAVPGMMQVNSQFFQINAKVTLGNNVFCMESLVLRESASSDGGTTPKVSVLSRQHNTLCEEQSPITTNSDEDLS